MTLVITGILSDSLIENEPLTTGDEIITINGHKINDFLDLEYYAADKILEIKYRDQNNKISNLLIEKRWEEPLGIIPEHPKCKKCINNCIFCFIDQMKKHIRKTLYIKDDDFRFSFLYGNFITLTNLSKRDFDKIIEQRLSPLYISVHTTDIELHKKMLRYRKKFNILEKLRYLSRNGINFHTQIVIVPGWNDGKQLKATLDDLTAEEMNTLSVGLVPVGLTKYRDNLVQIDGVDKKLATQILHITDEYDRTYCADEIYLLANKSIPRKEYYDDFPQLENGIGMIRLFLENWKLNKEKFIEDLSKLKENIVFITGVLFYSFLKDISQQINKILAGKSRVVAVKNNFLGKMVTVGGLISVRDLLNQVELQDNEMLALSSNIFNNKQKTIDSIKLKDLESIIGKKVLIIDEEFAEWDLSS